MVNRAPSGPDDLAGRIPRCRFFNIPRPILPPQAPVVAVGSAFIYLFPPLSIFSFPFSPFSYASERQHNRHSIGLQAQIAAEQPSEFSPTSEESEVSGEISGRLFPSPLFFLLLIARQVVRERGIDRRI